MTDGLVLRHRLFDRLSSAPQVCVVAAPSGFGKTTLLRSWVDARPVSGRALVWVALSGEVATRKALWQTVVTTAARRGELDAEACRALITRIEALDDPVPAIAELLDGRGPMLIVLDAYEHLRDLTAAIDDDVVRLTTAVAGLGIVVTTRGPTRLSGDVLTMRGLVRVIGEAELRFGADEVAELLGVHAPHAVDAAERIAGDTLGYPLSVRAMVHALAHLDRAPAFDDTAWRRLVAEDLESQIADPGLAEVVLDTCVPPYFDRELACQLTGADAADVDAALAELEWNGFGRWIPYARGHPAFQYVESVRDVFLGRLQVDQPERYERAAGLAAAWLHRHDDHDLALALAIDARQYELASRICRSLVIANPDVFATGTFVRHLRRVPRNLLPRHPVLAFILAMAYSSNPATRGSAAEYFRVAAKHALDDVERLTPREVFFHYVGLEVSLRFLGHSREAGAAAEAGLAYLDAMSAVDRDELAEFLPMALSILAYSRFQVGDTDRANALVDQATAAADDPWWRSYAAGFAVGIHAFDGRGPDARATLAMADAAAWAIGNERRVPSLLGIVGQAALRLDEFDLTGALGEFEGIEPLVETGEPWPMVAWVLLHARLGLGEAIAEAHRIEEVLAMTPPRLGVGPNLATAALLDTLAITWLGAGNGAKARQLLRAETPCPGQLAPARLLSEILTGDLAHAVHDIAALLALPGHSVRSIAAVDTLGAVASLRAGNARTALRLLERAASRHQLFGVRAQLMYVPEPDLLALCELAEGCRSAACVAYLAGPIPSPIALAGSAPVQLTRREAEVLSAWARHRTRADVAAELFVSANTVRSQLNSAYRKLGVTTKDAAIQRAIELDLLSGTDR